MTEPRCSHTNRSWTIGGPEDGEGHVVCHDCGQALHPDEDRWVVNPIDEALEFEGGKYAIASWDLDWHAYANGSLPPHAHAALVAAVRDADTLRQARELAAGIQGTRVYARPSRIADLLDLLAPVPDTGAEP